MASKKSSDTTIHITFGDVVLSNDVIQLLCDKFEDVIFDTLPSRSTFIPSFIHFDYHV